MENKNTEIPTGSGEPDAQNSPKMNEGDTKELKQKKVSKIKDTGKKKTKHGVVYLSCIPQSMSVKRLREEMDKHGETGNIFLQPDEKAPFHRHKQFFTEGWVEFHDKRVAKQVAAMLNNTQVGGRRKHPWYADIWNIKYLPKFQWAHLNERLAYERAIHEQRLRAEISQIKRESSFHKENFKKSKKMKSMEARKHKQVEEREEGVEEEEDVPTYTIRQRETEEEILAKKRKLREEGEGGGGKKKVQRRERRKPSNHRPDCSHSVGALSLAANKSLLHKLFGGGGGS